MIGHNLEMLKQMWSKDFYKGTIGVPWPETNTEMLLFVSLVVAISTYRHTAKPVRAEL